jgi:hypothetical protein
MKDAYSNYDDLVGNVHKAARGLAIEEFVPYRRHILVEQLPGEDKWGEIIEKPDNQIEAKAFGVVLKTCPLDENSFFEPGQLIVWREGSGENVELEEGRKLVVLQWFDGDFDGDIYGVWPKGYIDRLADEVYDKDEEPVAETQPIGGAAENAHLISE